ncbi:hypothetical protein FF38_14153 [Lucilia cuprina]|uniref:Uncharacterized protein n=1 Tax=Lucilia cuprina TaxID=7375 RepID=A0A0L0BT01_LUCCU|nr:hypothetical protein FF38_14153 [Lucilia cuprina]
MRVSVLRSALPEVNIYQNPKDFGSDLSRPGGHTYHIFRRTPGSFTTIPSKRSFSGVVVTLKRASSSLDGDVNSTTSFLKLSSASFTSSAQLNSGISSGSISGFVSGSNGGNSMASPTGACLLHRCYSTTDQVGGEHAKCLATGEVLTLVILASEVRFILASNGGINLLIFSGILVSLSCLVHAQVLSPVDELSQFRSGLQLKKDDDSDSIFDASAAVSAILSHMTLAADAPAVAHLMDISSTHLLNLSVITNNQALPLSDLGSGPIKSTHTTSNGFEAAKVHINPGLLAYSTLCRPQVVHECTYLPISRAIPGQLTGNVSKQSAIYDLKIGVLIAMLLNFP